MSVVFKNGHIYTMDQEKPYATALAVRGGRIAYVGNNEGARRFEDGADVVDLGGKMVIPGMIDAHCHPILSAVMTSGIILTAEMTKEDVFETVKAYIDEHPDKTRYFGVGYPEWVFDPKTGPSRQELDAICADKPVFLFSNGMHEGWCNTKTLEVLGIDAQTPDPVPGRSYYRRDGAGYPTGSIIETKATQNMLSAYPWYDEEDLDRTYRSVFDMYAKLGVTGFVECGSFEGFEDQGFALIAGYERQGALKQRFCGSLMIEDRERAEYVLDQLDKAHSLYDSDMFRINTMKIVNDGTMESENAAMDEPFLSGNNGEVTIEGEKLYSLCEKAASRGFDIHIHGIGDRAIHENLCAAKRVREAGYYDTRFTNAHTQMVRPEDIPMFAKYNVLANTSSIWHYDYPEAIPSMGQYRFDHQFPLQSILRCGARMTLGSDFPADEMGCEPLKGIQMGVTRQIYSDPNAPIMQPESERLSVEQCLAAYTINAAYGMHMDDRTGSLTEGKYADLVVLERDITDIEPHDIMNVKVLLTMLEGRPTWRDDAFEI